jgi:hypothetical protein
VVSILNQTNSSIPLQHISPRSILILSTHYVFAFPRYLFSSGFLTSNLYAVFSSPFVLNALPISPPLTRLFWSYLAKNTSYEVRGLKPIEMTCCKLFPHSRIRSYNCLSNLLLSAWSRDLFEMLIDDQELKNSRLFMDFRYSLSCSQEPTTVSRPLPHIHTNVTAPYAVMEVPQFWKLQNSCYSLLYFM